MIMRIANPIGRRGEDLACDYLSKHGFKILERNYRKGYGEIDIIAIDQTESLSVLAFIEVKTRTSSTYGTPFEAITYHKLQTLIKTAEYYKMIHPHLPDGMRIDAISVRLTLNGQIVSIELMRNIG